MKRQIRFLAIRSWCDGELMRQRYFWGLGLYITCKDKSWASFKSPLTNAFLISRMEKLHDTARLTWTLYLDNSGCLFDSSLLQRSWIKQARSSEIPAYFCNYYISRLLAVIRNGLTHWVLGLLPWSSPRGCPESALASIRNTLLPFYLVARKRFPLPCRNSTMFEESASMWLFHS